MHRSTGRPGSREDSNLTPACWVGEHQARVRGAVRAVRRSSAMPARSWRCRSSPWSSSRRPRALRPRCRHRSSPRSVRGARAASSIRTCPCTNRARFPVRRYRRSHSSSGRFPPAFVNTWNDTCTPQQITRDGVEPVLVIDVAFCTNRIEHDATMCPPRADICRGDRIDELGRSAECALYVSQQSLVEPAPWIGTIGLEQPPCVRRGRRPRTGRSLETMTSLAWRIFTERRWGPPALLGAERRHRLHSGRPARRQIARKQRDDREDARH
jgi:hypothetical protein